MKLFYYLVVGGELTSRLKSLQILKEDEKLSRLDVLAKNNAYDIGIDTKGKPYLSYPYVVDSPMFKRRKCSVAVGFDTMYAHFPNGGTRAGRQLLVDLNNSKYITKQDLVDGTLFGEPTGFLKNSSQPILIVKNLYDILIMSVWDIKEPHAMKSNNYIPVTSQELLWLEGQELNSLEATVLKLKEYSEGGLLSFDYTNLFSKADRLVSRIDSTNDRLELWKIRQNLLDLCTLIDASGGDSHLLRSNT
jgi:hypothetical protein